MIKKIVKIKNLGIFSDYQWDGQILTDFERYNLFYGWNGSGKTTLTKLFSSLENGLSSEFSDLDYEIDTETGTFKTGQKFNSKVRVFNQDYIDNNIEILGSKAKPIFILGEENKTIAVQITKDEELLKSLQNEKKKQEDLKNKKEVEKARRFTDVAKVIGANVSGSSIRNYRKPEAEKAFGLIVQKEILDEDDVNKCLLALKQEEEPKIAELNSSSFFKELNDVAEKGKELCLKTVESLVIERLKQNLDISQWVEAGLSLHLKHGAKVCEFCNQNLPENRINELVNYFNEEDQKLKKSLDVEILKLKQISQSIESLIPIDKKNFYVEFRTEYVSKITTFNKEKVNLLGQISDLVKMLEDKKSKTTEKVDLEMSFVDRFEKVIEAMNVLIKNHNGKTANFQEERDLAQKKLENHYLSEIFDEVKALDNDIEQCDAAIDKITNGNGQILGIIKLTDQITGNKAIISSEHKACQLLNQNLETFLGRKEIVFEVAPSGGYIIKRNGGIAKNLSEGEKTAIAFVYFVVNLGDQDFNIEDGIIVVDDPVSSLDSNSLFQAFSFLKNSVEGAKQVFLFTHNFDFLRLLLNWLNFFYRNQSKPYFMIGNKILGDVRTAEIKKIDPLLRDHESEYHYLCKILFEFETDGTIAKVYHIPNVARKALETFLMFRVPNGDTTYKKLETLDFDKIKKTSIYKFTNDQSHITGRGFDPSLVVEAQNNVKYLLEMFEAVFPEHFNILKKSIVSD